MRIENIVCSQRTELKLEAKHNVTLREARQVFFSRPRMRFVENGYTVGEDVYAAFARQSAVDICPSFSSTNLRVKWRSSSVLAT